MKNSPFYFQSLNLLFFLLIVPSVSSGLPSHAFEEYNERYIKDSLSPLKSPAKTFYVSQKKGRDGNNGSKALPVKSFEAAQELVRKYREEHGMIEGGVKVLIGEGRYNMKDGLTFDSRDNGTPDSPTVWQGVDQKKVILSGGTSIDVRNLQPIAHQAGLNLLHPKARGKVMGIDLQDVDVSGFLSGRGEYGSLSMDGHFLQLAQWPNVGYHHVGKIHSKGPMTRFLKPGEKPPSYSIENPTGGKFSYRESLPKLLEDEFTRSGDMRVQGYLHNDWYFQDEPIGGIKNSQVQLLHHTRYGIEDMEKGIPRRAKLVNVLAELDQPGEWYYDFKNRGLYIWPVPGFRKETSSLVIPGGVVIVRFLGTEHITLRGVTIENSGELAVEMKNGHHNLIADSIIRNGRKRGVNISGGRYNGISGCLLHDLESAFKIAGGNFRDLERCYHFATNNEIHSCRKKGYGMIGLNGVGIRFAHNLLHDMNGAVSFSAVDLLMEYNEFYNIGYEMGDFNLAYCGAQWWSMGNVIRFNFVHHIIEPGGHPVCPFRNDDGGAGLNIFGNVFYRTGRCAAQFAGPANTLENNIALEMPIFWWTHKCVISEPEIKKRWDRLSRFGRDLPRGDKGDFIYSAERVVSPKFWEKSPWKDEYPQVAEFIKVNPWAQTLGRVDRNYSYNVRNPFHIHGGDGTTKGMSSKKKGTFKDLPKTGVFRYPEPIKMGNFENPRVLNFKLKSSFKKMKDFVDIPFEKIGLKESPFRSSMPIKDRYRGEVYKKFKKDTARGYAPKTVNSRYPIPTYLRKSK